jgi:hypothetical protein
MADEDMASSSTIHDLQSTISPSRKNDLPAGGAGRQLGRMAEHSRQIQSVAAAFEQNGWACELVEGHDVLRAGFDAHHTRINLLAQAYTPLNALSMVAEVPLALDPAHLRKGLELLARANKALTLGGFEYDLDREMLVFRIGNLFSGEIYDAKLVAAMVHCAVAETDRLVPYAAILRDTPADRVAWLDLEALLAREDVIPPVPEPGE